MKNTWKFALGALIFGKLQAMGGFSYFKRYDEHDVSKKVIVITGGSDGIGLETTKALLDAKKVIVASRSHEKMANLLAQHSNVEHVKLDLSDFNSVEQFCKTIKQQYGEIDILINNAGVYSVQLGTTIQGFEQHFGVNYLAHFLLTSKLLNIMKNDSESRIIQVSSRAHQRIPQNLDFDDFLLKRDVSHYKAWEYYPISKLANVMFINSMKQYLQSNGLKIQVYSLHPGVVNTTLLNHVKSEVVKDKPAYISAIITPLMWYFTKTPSQGARNQIYLARATTAQLENGAYYNGLRVGRQNEWAQDQDKCEKLFNSTVEYFRKLGHTEFQKL